MEAKIRNLHKVTTLSKPIPIAKEHVSVCEVWALTKFTNRRNHQLSPRKPEILALISINICGQLPLSREGYAYFLEIVDNHSRRTWLLFLKKRSDTIEALKRWKLRTECETGAKIKAVRSDNAPELKTVIDEWCASIGISPQYTISYMSTQNRGAELGIRTIKNSMRAVLKDAIMFLEFWPEAAAADFYLRNRVSTGPIIDGNPTSPMQVLTGEKPSIDHIRVWGCKCYTYQDLRCVPSHNRHGKLTDKAVVGVFVGYDEETDKHFHVYVPERKYIVRCQAIKFSENEPGGSIELNLKVHTSSTPKERKAVGRPRKVIASAPMPSTVLVAVGGYVC